MRTVTAVAVILVIGVAIAGVSSAFWLSDRLAKTTTTTTTTWVTLQTLDIQGKFKANSTDILILDVYGTFSTLDDKRILYPNESAIYSLPGWEWTFEVSIIWMNISPKTMYVDLCPGVGVNGTVLASSDAVAKQLVTGRGYCPDYIANYSLVTVPPMGVHKSHFIGAWNAVASTNGALVARGSGIINMSLSLSWWCTHNLSPGWCHKSDFTASVPTPAAASSYDYL